MQLIAIEGIELYGYHGVYETEAQIGGWYSFDTYIKTDWQEAAEKDDINLTLNYQTVYQICKAQNQVRRNLIETLCQAIYNEIKATFKLQNGLKVRVSKLNPPVGGKAKRTYVEMG